MNAAIKEYIYSIFSFIRGEDKSWDNVLTIENYKKYLIAGYFETILVHIEEEDKFYQQTWSFILYLCLCSMGILLIYYIVCLFSLPSDIYKKTSSYMKILKLVELK